MTVAVVGAGISGLVAARKLRAAGADVVQFEATSRVGGKLRTETLAGNPFDVGAEAFLARRPEALRLVEELGLPIAHPGSARASILAGGDLHAIPTGTVMGVPTSVESAASVLSAEAVTRLEQEPDRAPLHLDADVSVGELVRTRLGDEVADRLVDPLLGGVYAGRADSLGVRATMPALAAAVDRHGSVLRAAESLAPPTPSGAPVFGAVRGGYGVLLDALTEDVQFDTVVTAIRKEGARWRLTLSTAPELLVDAVLLAVPAPAAAKLLGEIASDSARALAEVELASMAVVGLAVDVDLPQRSGVLLASGERHRDGKPFSAKAFTFSSRKWTHLPGGLLRASVGRFGDVDVLRRSDDELVDAVRADLAELTGITAKPIDTLVQRWGGGLPQYGVGHVDRIARAESALPAGIAVAGAAMHGVGVAPCIATATSAAARILSA